MPTFRPFVFWLFVLLAVSQPLAAQQIYKFKHYTQADGLSINAVRTMVQDADGFIWMGTPDGLNRFDGYEFKIYKHVFGDSTSLGDNYLYRLYIDPQGTLWACSASGGVSRYNRQTDTFTNYLHKPNDPSSLNNNYTTAITRDLDGYYWVGTSDHGINRMQFDKKTNQILRATPAGLLSDRINYLLTDTNGHIWVATDLGISRFRSNKAKSICNATT